MPIRSVDIAASLDSSGVDKGVAQATNALDKLTTPLNDVIGKAIEAAKAVEGIGQKPVVVKVDQGGLTKLDQQFNRIVDKIALQQRTIGKSSIWADIEKTRMDFDRRNARVKDPWQRGADRIAFNNRMEGATAQVQAYDDQVEAVRAAEAATQKRLADERAVLDTVKGLQREYDRLALSKEQILRADLASVNATQDQIEEAVQLRRATDELAKQKNLQEQINRLMLDLKEQGTKRRGPNASRVDTVRTRAQEVYGDDLPPEIASQLGAADRAAVALDKRKKNLGFAMLTLGRGVQDFQAAGLMGIVNNVEGLGVAMGMTAGQAGALTLGIVGLQVTMPVLRNTIGDFAERNLPGLYEAFNNAAKGVGDFFDTSNRGSVNYLKGQVKSLTAEFERLNEKGTIYDFDEYMRVRNEFYSKSRTLKSRETDQAAYRDAVTDPRSRAERLDPGGFAARSKFLDARLTGEDWQKIGGLGVNRMQLTEAEVRAQKAQEALDSADNRQARIAAAQHGANAMADYERRVAGLKLEAELTAKVATNMRDQMQADEELTGAAIRGDKEALKTIRDRIEASKTLSKADRDRQLRAVDFALDPMKVLRENDLQARRQNAPTQTFAGENRVREMREEAAILDVLLTNGTKLRDIEFEKALAIEKARLAYQGVDKSVVDQIETQTRAARAQGLELSGRERLDAIRKEAQYSVALTQSGISLNSIAERRAQIDREYRQNLDEGMPKRIADEIRLVQLVKDEAEQRRKVNDELKRGAIDLANPGLTGRVGDVNRRLQMGEITPEQAARLGAQAKALNQNDKRVAAVQDVRAFGQSQWESTRTFQERQRSDLSKLTAARELGFIDPSTFNRSLRSRARENVATGEVAAVQAGSVEAYTLNANRKNQSEQYLSNLVGLQKESQQLFVQIRDGINQMKTINDNLIDSGENATAGDYNEFW